MGISDTRAQSPNFYLSKMTMDFERTSDFWVQSQRARSSMLHLSSRKSSQSLLVTRMLGFWRCRPVGDADPSATKMKIKTKFFVSCDPLSRKQQPRRAEHENGVGMVWKCTSCLAVIESSAWSTRERRLADDTSRTNSNRNKRSEWGESKPFFTSWLAINSISRLHDWSQRNKSIHWQ